MTRKFLRRRFVNRIDANQAGIESLNDALDCAALPRRIRSLEHENNGDLFFMQLELHRQKLELVLLDLAFVFLLREGFRLIQFVKA